MATQIAPIGFHSKHIYAPIKKYKITKLIIIKIPGKDEESRTKIRDTLKQVEKLAKEVIGIDYEVKDFDPNYDLEEMVRYLQKIFDKEEEVLVNLTGGPKLLSIALYITSLKNYEKVLDIVYVREDIHESVSIPKYVFTKSQLTNFEREIIIKLKECRECKLRELAEELNRSESQVARYVSGLRKKGIVETSREDGGKIIKLRHGYI